MSTETRHVYRTEVVAAWQAAYQAWEDGRAASPSAWDLVMIAEEAMGVAFVDQEALSEALWTRHCEGGELEALADWLLDHAVEDNRPYSLTAANLRTAYWQLRDLEAFAEADSLFGLGLVADEADHGEDLP